MFQDNDGHLLPSAAVPVGLMACYLRQHPSAINELAMGLLSRMPFGQLHALMGEAERRLGAESIRIDELPSRYPERYDRLQQELKKMLFLRHPVLDRLLPLSEIVLCNGELNRVMSANGAHPYRSAKQLLNRLRLDDDTWKMFTSRFKMLGVPLDDGSLFERCVKEEPQRYQDIYNDLQMDLYMRPMRHQEYYSDLDVLFMKHILETPEIVPADKDYVFQSSLVRDQGMWNELERQLEQRPLLRGLGAEEQRRIVAVHINELNRFVQHVADYPVSSVCQYRRSFIVHGTVEKIVSPYRPIRQDLLTNADKRVWQSSWDLIDSQRDSVVPRDVAEAAAQLVAHFGSDRVDVRSLRGKTVGEAQYECLDRLMAGRGLVALAEIDRVRFTAAFYWGTAPELRDWVEKALAKDSSLNRMTATEQFLEQLPVDSPRLRERINLTFVRYMRTCGVALALSKEQVAQLLRPQHPLRQLRSRVGRRR